MDFLMKTITGTAFAAVLFSLSNGAATQAPDVVTMTPVQALSFNVETKHAVSYFLSANGTCKLVLTVAEAPDAEDVTKFVATRFEAAIDAGKTTRFDVITGKSLDFACQADAQSMSVTAVDQVASRTWRL